MVDRISISIVSYLNSKPFIYGIEHSDLNNKCHIQLDIPSVCAEKLMTNRVDIGLVPVAIIPRLSYSKILTNYCIGADGPVKSVMLVSHVPLHEIKQVCLDYQSRTSVLLTKVLSKHFWNISPEWLQVAAGYEKKIMAETAGVIIGDRALTDLNKFPYVYDLSEQWKKYTGLPFVFACWVANKELSSAFELEFNNAIEYGVQNRLKMIEQSDFDKEYQTDAKNYLLHSISYDLDNSKKKALELFHSLSKNV